MYVREEDSVPEMEFLAALAHDIGARIIPQGYMTWKPSPWWSECRRAMAGRLIPRSAGRHTMARWSKCDGAPQRRSRLGACFGVSLSVCCCFPPCDKEDPHKGRPGSVIKGRQSWTGILPRGMGATGAPVHMGRFLLCFMFGIFSPLPRVCAIL